MMSLKHECLSFLIIMTLLFIPVTFNQDDMLILWKSIVWDVYICIQLCVLSALNSIDINLVHDSPLN